MSWTAIAPGEGAPVFDNAKENFTPELYVNMARLFAEGLTGAIKPSVGTRQDGQKLFYPGSVNVIFGEPESGKTLLAECVLADEIFLGNGVLFIDLDHNGAQATAERFRSLGVSEAQLSDTSLFRYCEPESPEELLQVIAEAQVWKPTVALVDSVGEVIPLFNGNSNSGDDYTAVHRQVFSPLAKSGICVIAIDHVAKNEGSQSKGAIGTIAKQRTPGGAVYRVTRVQPFIKGTGGKARLHVVKDRNGAIREVSSPVVSSGREQLAATFHLISGEATNWKFYTPEDGDARADSKTATDLELLKLLDPPPVSIRDAQARLQAIGHKRGKDSLSKALKLFKEEQEAGSVPVPLPIGERTRTTLTPVPQGQIRTSEGQGQEGREE
jgi:hypothetical protein